MFGKNQVLKPVWEREEEGNADRRRGAVLTVHSIFPTIQGEGPNAGLPCVFVRLTGCNLRCHFCDTEFETGADLDLDEICSRVRGAMHGMDTDLIVLSGGEPLRQPVVPMLLRFSDEGWYTQIETAGTLWPPAGETAVAKVVRRGHPTEVSLEAMVSAGEVELVCSPKTPKIHPEVARWCKNFKYIIRKGHTTARGLPEQSTQVADKNIPVWTPDREDVLKNIWLQPCEEYFPRPVPGGVEVPNQEATMVNAKECARLAMKHGYRLSLQLHKILGLA